MTSPHPVERLLARPWRVMEWTYPQDGPKYAVCVEAFADITDAWDALERHPGAWVESVPENKTSTHA